MPFYLPTLVHVYEEYDVIAEAGQTMRSRHCYDEGEEIVDKGVESLKNAKVIVSLR